MLTMNSVALDRWTKGMESNLYQRGIGFLGRKTNVALRPTGGGYIVYDEPRVVNCPLGVLCEQAVKAGIIPPAQWASDEGIRVARYYNIASDIGHAARGQTGNLPTAVRDWCGFETEGDPLVKIDHLDREYHGLARTDDSGYVGISTLNDHGILLTFSAISSMVRKTYASVADA
jgi:hypothetical protein